MPCRVWLQLPRTSTPGASTLVGLAHEYLMPEGKNMPAGLDARISAFGPGGNLLEGLVAKNMVSGLSTSLVVLMGHGISIDDSLVETIPDYTEEQRERATVDAHYPSSAVKGEA